MFSLCRTARFSLLLLIAVLAASGTALADICVAGPTTLCLNNQRFRLDVEWKTQSGAGAGQAVPLTSDTGYFWFFASSNVELVVKVIDGRGLNSHFWVFFGALSNVEYTMRVTDSVTGSARTYFNPAGQFASVGDTEAFSASGTVGLAQRSVEVSDDSISASPFTFTAFSEHVLPSAVGERAVAAAVSTCVGTETSLCLSGGRFRVEVTWRDFQGGTGGAKAISLTSDTGYFWFFNSANVELVVKVLDARTLNNRFWVFYGALSNVEYEMTVTDTLTGNVSTYFNPSGRFASTGDTDAFRAGYSVAAQLDQSRAVSSDIPTTGGTISATASDGTVFTLSVPRDALLSDTRITMTPVAAIEGLPLSGGLAAAVDLEPAGLRLFEMATLTIAPAVAIPIADEITFAWRGNGEEFFLYPAELGTPISMKLMHFSGYGVGRGTAADQAAQQQRVPASPEDALSQRLQELFASQRRAQSSGLVVADDFVSKVVAELRAYYDNVLEPELEAARTNCKKAKAVAPRALSWARAIQLLGSGEAEVESIMSWLVDALANCYNESFDQCVSRNDPTQVQQMLSFARQLALLGASDRIDESKLMRCVRFELDFESVIHEVNETDSRFAWDHQVRALVPVALEPSWEIRGNADLIYSKVTYTGILEGCQQTSVGANSVFQVFNIAINFNVVEGGGPPPHPLTMTYDPGYPNLRFTFSCPEVEPIVIEGPRWRTTFYDDHHSGEQSGGGFLARDWSRVGGAIYARRTYQIPSSFAEETTIMNLKHTPQ